MFKMFLGLSLYECSCQVFGHIFFISLIQTGIVSHWVVISLAAPATAKLFSKMAISFPTPTSN